MGVWLLTLYEVRMVALGGLFDFNVSLNQTNWFRVFVDMLRFGFELENLPVRHHIPCISDNEHISNICLSKTRRQHS